ncbi:hypothetical protein ACFVYC_18505 [Pseudarthrobacter sp. NPDC058329]|uniref:hypothetical protein n=1 Tax=Pseudarthrobacter sp. NPDC058329 TaxID=3346448 RepID=UPI0036DE565A
MSPLPAMSVVLLTAIARLRAVAPVKPEDALMPEPELVTILSDPRGPEETMSSLSDVDLARLLDALYAHLDTFRPEPSAIVWYEIGVQESLRRDP